MQLDALVKDGVQKRDVFAGVSSGSRNAIERPGMKKLLEYAEAGDTVVVWRVDLLGRSLIDVLNTVNLRRERALRFGLDRPGNLDRADDAELLGFLGRVRARVDR